MRKFNSEAELEIATIPLIEKHFKHWSWQVPHYDRVLDFGGINKNGLLIGIEYKLADWKRAIWQAVAHRLVFDFLYILIPKRRVSEEMRAEAKKTGIGILLFNGKDIEVAVKPKFQLLQWFPKKKIVIRQIEIIALHDRTENVEAIRERVKQFNQLCEV